MSTISVNLWTIMITLIMSRTNSILIHTLSSVAERFSLVHWFFYHCLVWHGFLESSLLTQTQQYLHGSSLSSIPLRHKIESACMIIVTMLCIHFSICRVCLSLYFMLFEAKRYVNFSRCTIASMEQMTHTLWPSWPLLS